ncbi:FadR/GntR family transcriptional regulator [Xanthobacter sp. TB0139]|uniref:FadR/GntR family transcriptional regulator n=1 Tax=Xanthobacter sp. TB0139 TaxID=3459178 RepID=UPI00403A214F
MAAGKHLTGENRDHPLLQQIDRDPGYKRVAKAIEAEITSGRLKVGEFLPAEADLAEQLGVHRSTVREGIRALESAALVRRAGGKKLMVCAPPAAAIERVNARAMSMMKVSFVELWEIQMKLEPFAARLAALRITPELKDALKKNVAALREHLQDDERVILLDIEFHGLIAAASQNTALELASAPTRTLVLNATTDLYNQVPQARHRLLQAHEAVLNAVLSGNADEAECWMKRHINDFRRGYEVAGFDMNAAIRLRS